MLSKHNEEEMVERDQAIVRTLQEMRSNLQELGFQYEQIFESSNFHQSSSLCIPQSTLHPKTVLRQLIELFLLVQSNLQERLLQYSNEKSFLEEQPEIVLQIMKLGSFCFHEYFLCHYWMFSYYKCLDDDAPQMIFYDELKWLFYAQKQLSNFHYWIEKVPVFREILDSQANEDPSIESEEKVVDISVYSYDIFTYHCINSFLLATKQFVQMKQEEFQRFHDQSLGVPDAPSIFSSQPTTRCFLPKQVRHWFEFFDETILRKFISFVTLSPSASSPLLSENSDSLALTQKDYPILLSQFLETIEEPPALLQWLSVTCLLYRKHRPISFQSQRDLVSSAEPIEHLLTVLILRYLRVMRRPGGNSEDSSPLNESQAQQQSDQAFLQLIDQILLKYEFPYSLLQQWFPSSDPLTMSSPASSSSSAVASSSVFLFQKRESLLLLCKLIDIWGSPFFHNNAVMTLYESYSHWILRILQTSITKDDLSLLILPISSLSYSHTLSSSSSTSISVEALVAVETLLIEAISKGLESSFPIIRYYTMKIAEEYAKIMGYPLVFDELKQYEADRISLLAPPATNSASELEKQQKTVLDDDNEEDEDEDEEEEIQGYLLSKECDSILQDLYIPSPLPTLPDPSAPTTVTSAVNQLPHLLRSKRLYYLKQCLELLSAPEGTQDIREGIILALEQLPKIVEKHPWDGKQHADTLLFQLLNLSNPYNIESFEELRAAAIISLVREYPVYTLPLLNQSILNADLSLGLRVQSIQYHRKIAGLLFEDTLREEHEAAAAAATASEGDLPPPTPQHPKAVIKRPRRYQLLLQQQRKQRYQQEKQSSGSGASRRNRFQEYSAFFFHPLLQLLQTFHQRYAGTASAPLSSTPTSAVSWTRSKKEESFNLIARSFSDTAGEEKTRSPWLVIDSDLRKKDSVEEITELRLPSSSSASVAGVGPLIQEINEQIDREITSVKTGKKISQAHPAGGLLDETDLLLPYDALLSLATFLRYFIFHPQYKTMAVLCLEASIAFYQTFQTTSLALRRGALCLLVTALEGFLATYSSSSSSSSSINSSSLLREETRKMPDERRRKNERIPISGVLDSLLKITAVTNSAEAGGGEETLEGLAEELLGRGGRSDSSSSSSALAAMKTELLTASSLLPFTEKVLQQLEKHPKQETDPLCQQLLFSFLTMVQEQFLQ